MHRVGQFGSTAEACPLSGIKKAVRLWEVVSVYLDSDFDPCHIHVASVFIERLSSSGRVRYGRFHCIVLCVTIHISLLHRPPFLGKRP